jgi:hypothetical protein
MKPALHKSTSIKRPAPTKYMKTSKSIRKSISSMNDDFFNVEEMMTKNKIKKFREIGLDERDLNNTSLSIKNDSR